MDPIGHAFEANDKTVWGLSPESLKGVSLLNSRKTFVHSCRCIGDVRPIRDTSSTLKAKILKSNDNWIAHVINIRVVSRRAHGKLRTC